MLSFYPKYPEIILKITKNQKLKQIVSYVPKICHMPQNKAMTPSDLEGSNFKPL